MNKRATDQDQRDAALDPSGSFIVQAPAGSGKTELLIQRILVLLATVRRPEEVLAITFTRKAAAEMRDRVLDALTLAGGSEPCAGHQKTTWRLARSVLRRDQQLDWHLLDNPSRLRIRTIDSLCASLVRQMPLSAATGAAANAVDDSGPLYKQAARNTLKSLNEPEIGAHVRSLLAHMENNLFRIESLITEMLARRDQWLGVITASDARQVIELGLQRVITDHLSELRAAVPGAVTTEIIGLAAYAATNLAVGDSYKGELSDWLERDALPGSSVESLAAWQDLANLVLVKNNAQLRKQVNKNNGFPAGKANQAAKQRFRELLAALSEHPRFTTLLHRTRRLPDTHFTDAQWQLLGALRALLLHAVAELQLLFQARGEMDHAEVQLRAMRALGDMEHPTDLALALDYRIQHMLVDEFQDTSSSQFHLLGQLCAGWSPDDGHSLFLVGDPMQSIYRFRNAEIGLYLQARSSGINGLPLTPLTLSVNFRSQANIVDWVNRTFSRVFPQQTDPATGTVAYNPSSAFRDPGMSPAVEVIPSLYYQPDAEATQVTQRVQQVLEQTDSGHSIAILASGRNQLKRISRELKYRRIAFQAVDILPLQNLPTVRDLRSLTRALLHPADRLSWLSLLRAPWCGLSHHDLLLVGADSGLEIPSALQDRGILAGLSESGRIAVQRLSAALLSAIRDRRRKPLRQWVEGTWIALGGADCLLDELDVEAARTSFDLLEQHDRGGSLEDLAQFDLALDKLFAPPDPAADGRVQLMTIHKSKGLQFGTVILPGLGCGTRGESKKLLQWLERPNHTGDVDLLVAPIQVRDAREEASYRYLHETERLKVLQERNRLIYVAATRAEERLILFGHCGWNEKSASPGSPAAGSLLASLWPALEPAFVDLRPRQADGGTNEEMLEPQLSHLVDDWLPPELPVNIGIAHPVLPEIESDATALEFDWASETARHVGTLVHRFLQRIADQGLSNWPASRIDALQPAIRQGLARLGVTDQHLAVSSAQVTSAISRTLGSDRGRWILEQHDQAATELALSSSLDGVIRHHVIDRTFIDNSGLRWIIDYKTGRHEGSGTDIFLDQEQDRYRAQLENYARLFENLEQRSIRLGLYFPSLDGWREWSWPK